MALIKKALIQRSIPMLEQVHETVIEYLQYLQSRHQNNIQKRINYLQKEIDRLEELNTIIFHVYSEIEKRIHLGFKNKKRR